MSIPGCITLIMSLQFLLLCGLLIVFQLFSGKNVDFDEEARGLVVQYGYVTPIRRTAKFFLKG